MIVAGLPHLGKLGIQPDQSSPLRRHSPFGFGTNVQHMRTYTGPLVYRTARDLAGTVARRSPLLGRQLEE